MGYFAYDYMQYAEPAVSFWARDENGLNDADLMLFDRLIAFDNFRQRILFSVNIPVDDSETGYRKSLSELDVMENLIWSGSSAAVPKGHLMRLWRRLNISPVRRESSVLSRVLTLWHMQ